MIKKINPYHFTQAFNINVRESDLDFYDVNLYYDTRLFVDPFLIKNSPILKERELFKRFGIFFKLALKKSISTSSEIKKLTELSEFLSFHEPKEILLGYTENSNKGSGLSSSFATALFHFFLNQTAAKIISDENLYPDKQIDPEIFSIFVDGVADDGISDLSANLIMDFLIEYTQKQCKKFKIPLKILPVNQTFNFKDLSWTGGVNAYLPENPLRPGEPVVLVPKRFLRAGEKLSGEEIKRKAVGILRKDPYLSKRFSATISKNLNHIKVSEIRKVLSEDNNVLKVYIKKSKNLQVNPYDFGLDIFNFLAFKNLEKLFVKKKKLNNPKNPQSLLLIVEDFITYAKKYFETSDGSNLFWYTKGDKKRPVTEIVLGRVFRALGFLYFRDYPEITFDSEVKNNWGLIDFRIVYKNMNIVIELKLLSNDSNKGKPPIPAYIHGIKRQLPLYAIDKQSNYAVYITGQFYKKRDNEKDDVYGDRIKLIKKNISISKKLIESKNDKFIDLIYYNFDLTEKPTASNF